MPRGREAWRMRRGTRSCCCPLCLTTFLHELNNPKGNLIMHLLLNHTEEEILLTMLNLRNRGLFEITDAGERYHDHEPTSGSKHSTHRPNAYTPWYLRNPDVRHRIIPPDKRYYKSFHPPNGMKDSKVGKAGSSGSSRSNVDYYKCTGYGHSKWA